MTTQFTPVIQMPEDSNYGSFGDATRSEYRVLDGGWPTGSSRTDLVLPDPLVIDTNSALELNFRDQIRNWREIFNTDYPPLSSGSAALEAVEYIKRLLKMSEIKVADLVDISRNTIRNWRNGQGAYPSTVRKLFQVKHLIAALDSTMTQNQMSVWLNEVDDNDPRLSRLDRLAQPEGPALVAQQASSFLFPSPPGHLPPPAVLRRELEHLELEEKGWIEYEDSPRQYSARPRRQRPAQGVE